MARWQCMYVANSQEQLSLMGASVRLCGGSSTGKYNLTTVKAFWAILALTLRGMSCQVIQKTALEGHTRSIDILCDIDQQIYPLYWNIQGKVYDLYSIPEIFEELDHEGIRLMTVDRRMDGWRFQCFTIGPNNEEGLNFGQITTLTVVYVLGTQLQDQRNNKDLLKPSLLGRPVLHYRQIRVGRNTTAIQWFYDPGTFSSCNAPIYRIDIFTQSEIDSAYSQRDLKEMKDYEASTKSKTICSHILMGEADIMNYLRISAVRADNSSCAKSDYFYGINIGAITTTDIFATGTSANFEIPENLRSDLSIQLVWSKDNDTQCVCPPVEQFMSQCACNIDDPNSNIITISNDNITISNLTNQMGYEGRITLYFVSSLSSACNGNCHLQSVAKVYHIIQGYPQAPIVNFYNASNMFCFTIPDNPIHPEVYEVNLTDSTGSQTRLSGVYNTSQCLTITSDLHPNVCGPFQLSVAVMNTVGREETTPTIIPDSTTAEPTPCDCYQQKETVTITSSTTPTSADLTVHCQGSEQRGRARDDVLTVTLHLIPSENTTARRDVTIPCNSTRKVNALSPLTSYSIERNSRQTCSLHHLTTDPANPGTIKVLLVISGVALVVAITFGCAMCCFLRHLKRRYIKEYHIENNAADISVKLAKQMK